MLKINEIRMDYEKEQIGITHVPEFSWTLESDKRNVIQDTWELEIAEDKGIIKAAPMHRTQLIMDNKNGSGIRFKRRNAIHEP